MKTPTTTPSLQGWDITHGDAAEWVPWGQDEKARAKILGSADGYLIVLVEAQTGYVGAAHEHAYPEFFYLVRGRVRNQGQELTTGDGYAAATGSTHDDLEALAPSTYVSVFRI